MRISDWSSDVCSSDLPARQSPVSEGLPQQRARVAPLSAATLRHSLVNLRLRGGRRQGGRQGRIASGLRLGCECVGVPPTAQRLVEIDQSERGAGSTGIEAGLTGKDARSEERRVGKECGSTCKYRWSQ